MRTKNRAADSIQNMAIKDQKRKRERKNRINRITE